MVNVKLALVSVSDKTGLGDFVRGLDKLGVKILSTGGTAKFIKELGINVINVSDHTGFPEMLDGRVKTLHPKIHGGLLALRNNASHIAQINEHGIELIDMVVVNLYPFEKVTMNPEITLPEAIENIDIGGPSMLRSAAKNYKSVAVIANPARYKEVLDELNKQGGTIYDDLLKKLALEVFETTSRYDNAIHRFLKNKFESNQETKKLEFNHVINFTLSKIQDLRYGENPHQKAAFYSDGSGDASCIANLRQLHGKELSFNNILDLNAAFEIVREFDEPAAVVIKHNNPCGAGSAKTIYQAYKDAFDCDPLSAFGGVIGLNRKVDLKLANIILKGEFFECILAPGFDKDALLALMKKKNLRLVEIKFGKVNPEIDIKRVTGGMLIQDKDLIDYDKNLLKVVTKKKPTKAQMDSLLFGFRISKHVKSNAIIFTKGTKTVGIGAGQMSRVDSVVLATRKSNGRHKGACLASDAFFPKEDAIAQAKKAGIVSIIVPGGSIRDEYVIKAADKAGISMVFTGIRHFKH